MCFLNYKMHLLVSELYILLPCCNRHYYWNQCRS